LCADDQLTGTSQAGFSLSDVLHLVRLLVCLPAGELGEARRLAHAALALFEERPVAEWRSWTLSQFALVADWTGEAAEATAARVAASDALGVAKDSGNVAAGVKALQAAGVAALLGDRPRDAAIAFERALSEARKHGSGLMDEGNLLAHLARAHLALADAPGARAAADEAVAVARRQGAKVVECFAHLVRARVLRETATGHTDLVEARAALAAGEALAVETGAATYAAFLAVGARPPRRRSPGAEGVRGWLRRHRRHRARPPAAGRTQLTLRQSP